jgi:glucose/arabinose dehydrogenase
MRYQPSFTLFAVVSALLATACSSNGGSATTDTLAPDTAAVDTRDPADTAAVDTAAPADTVPADTTPTPLANSCVAPAAADAAHASVPDGYCASVWATGLGTPRGMTVAPSGEILVVERSKSQVTVLWDDDDDGVSGAGERAALAKASGLNHGVAVHGGYLYASSSSTVYRWAYTDGARADLGAAEVVVKGVPTGGHATRTLAFDDAGALYVSVGSASNLDGDSSRARVRRFDVSSVPAGGLAFDSGAVQADGLRNEVGLAFDAAGRLWGVQNGVDQLNRADLGGDIHEDNPAEILSRLDTAGAFHGYPYCWTEFLLPSGVGQGPGTMWAHPNFMNDGTHSDAWCRDAAHVQPPALAMQAHSAPLGLTFYDGAAFPADVVGDAFVTFHGSWNRDTPTGYKVMRVHFEAGSPVTATPFLAYDGVGDIGAQWPHRPVDVAVAPDGRLLVTSDASGVVLVVGHHAVP